MKDCITHRKGRSQESAFLRQFLSPQVYQGNTGGWDGCWTKRGGLGQERSPGPQPSKQQKSHRPILAVPRIGQLGQACCVHLDLCGGLSYRNCSASAIGEACRLTTQKEFSRTFPASGGCPSRHRSLKVHALDYLLGIIGLNLFSFLGPNSTKLIFSSHDPYSWTLLATLRALVVFM